MNSIEELDLVHFSNRAAILERLRMKAQSMGFHPLPLTQDDIHAYWITLEANELHKGKTINVSTQDLHYEGCIDVLKEIAKYES